MKGTDVTEDQLNAARDFLEKIVIKRTVGPDERVVVRFDDYVRVVAWYGMIRAIGVENGCPAQSPGHAERIPPRPKLVAARSKGR